MFYIYCLEESDNVDQLFCDFCDTFYSKSSSKKKTEEEYLTLLDVQKVVSQELRCFRHCCKGRFWNISLEMWDRFVLTG